MKTINLNIFENKEIVIQQRVTLLQGNACNKFAVRKESVDLIVTSPPYNLGKNYDGSGVSDSMKYEDYVEFTKHWLSNCFRWIKSTGRICINVSLDKNKYGKRPLSSDVTKIAMDCGWKYHATIIWNEGNISKKTAWGSWKSASAPHVIAPVETVIVLYKDEWKRRNAGQNDITGEEFKSWVNGVWCFNGESAKRIGHEAPFPRELPKRCIKLFSFVGDTVLDPFSGSGTTIIESIKNGRKAVGIELEEKYCLLSIDRIERECKVKLKISLAARAGKHTYSCWKI